jgi:2-keto-3-deoxy-6-phosphogluconate aldolase
MNSNYMKKNYLKNWKYTIALCWAMVLLAPAFAQNLNVSGITTPSEANGIYTLAGTYSGYNYWSLTVGATTYVIYNDVYSTSGGTERYWNLDTNFDDEGTGNVLFYSSNSTTVSPPVGLSWGADAGVGSLTITAGVPASDIAVLGDGNAITDGNTTISSPNFTNIGSASISGGTASRIFTIRNTGSAALTLSGSSPYVTISGTNASSFTVTAAPAQSIAASTGTTTFTITFTPSSQGYHNAVVTINSNDPDDESVYTFNIQGYGFVAQSVVLSGITEPAAANGTYIHQGVINNFQYWKHQTLNYYLYFDVYSGGGYWDIDNNTDDADAYFFSGSENGTPVGLTGWTAATSGFSPLPTGTPVVNYAVLAPEINLKGNNTSITINDVAPSIADHTNFGSVDISSGNRTRTYTIENTGGAALTISGVTLGGTNASEFSKTNPVLTTVPAFGSTTFTVTFDPSTEGAKIATITIGNNDSDENPYIFTISGDAFIPRNVIVSNITTPAAANGTYIYQGIQNEFQYWKHESQEYYIFNDEYSNSNYWNIDVDLIDTDNDYLFFSGSAAVAPVGLTSWNVNTNAGNISSGSPTIVYASPEIDIKGNGNSMTDGSSTPTASNHTDFGPVAVPSATISRTFTINNTGNVSLSLSGTPIVAKSGTNAADFTITQPSSSSLAALTGTTSFTVEFNPSGAGLRTAELSIANNDSDESPYNFTIQGTGVDVPTVTTSAAALITITSAILGGNVTADGSLSVTERGIVYSITDATPTIAEGATKISIGSGLGVFAQLVPTFTPGTTYYYNSYAKNAYGTAYGTANIFTTQIIPVINWSNPADISYGTLLSATQLNATATATGTFIYTPALGTKLNTGSAQTLKVDFYPNNAALYANSSATVTINVVKATPVITWSNPAEITYGTLLSATQLNASADVPGTMVYTPALDSKLNAGAAQNLKVDFTPTDATNYNTATKTVTMDVAKANSIITWSKPAEITYGTLLSATQLNANADVPGTMVYTPALDSKLNAGAAQNLKVDFTPTDATNYNTATKTVTIDVAKANSIITWSKPAEITYGTLLSATQLNASSDVPGTMVYTPALDSKLNAGAAQNLKVDFTPTDATNYNTATKTVTIDVAKANSTITWSKPAGITYGTLLSATQLNASTDVPGTMVYTPALDSKLNAGAAQNLKVDFTPTDATNYNTATKTVTIDVAKANSTITWSKPAEITYGTLLSATQLNASADVPGTMVYTPALDSKLNAGAAQNLKVDFTPTDATNYNTATKTVTIDVSKATPVIAWSNPADISNVTALSSTQLNATADVSGVFTYTPALGTKLNVGNAQSLKVDFEPTDAVNYKIASKEVFINVYLATGTSEVGTNKLVVFPNPVVDAFSVSGIEGKVKISLTDLNGILILTKEISADEKVSVSNISSGIYIIKIEIGSGIILKQLVKK